MKIDIKCTKCGGTGYIEGFAHIMEGVCFRCHGTGILSISKSSDTFAAIFIRKFEQKGYCPDFSEKLSCYALKEHPTAQYWLMKDGTDYIAGQPICHGSGWFRIPESDFDEFSKYFLKVRKINLQYYK